MLKPLLPAAALLASLTTPLQAQDTLVGYWNLNTHTTRTAGTSGSLVTYYFGLGPEFMAYDAGTTVNLLPPSTAGQATLFAHFATIVGQGFVQVNGLDFTGLHTPTFSFAARKSAVADLFSTFRIEYNVGTGWQTATTLAEPGQEFSLVSYKFEGGELDGRNNVGLRIHFVEMVDFAAAVSFDNVKVTAVPEPTAIWALGGAAPLLCAQRLARRRASFTA